MITLHNFKAYDFGNQQKRDEDKFYVNPNFIALLEKEVKSSHECVTLILMNGQQRQVQETMQEIEELISSAKNNSVFSSFDGFHYD